MRFFKKIHFSFFIFILIISLSLAPIYVSASSDQLPFNLWSQYRNLITFVDANGVSHNSSVSDNNVLRSGNSTIIDNAQPLMDDLNYPYFKTVSLSVPNSALSPRVYISDLYLNRSFTMSVQIYVEADQKDSVTLNEVSLNNPRGFLYTEYRGSEYFNASVSNVSYNKLNDDSFSVFFNCTFNFNKPCYIYGFYFDIRGVFDFNVDGELLDFYSFYTKFTLSDLILTNDLTPEDVEDSVSSGILDATGGSDYDKLDDSTVNNVQDQEDAIIENIEQYKDASLDSSDFDLNSKLNAGDLVDLKSTMLGLSNLVTNKFINKLPFSVVIYFAVGLGAFGFVFGLATWSIGSISKQNSVKASRSRRSKGG